jgi:hypothetical protein
MDTKLTRRRVDYDDALTAGWPKFIISTPQPDRVLVWIAGHLHGPWSYRVLGSAEVVPLIGHVPEGHVTLVLAFQDPDDADAFEVRHAMPEGRA